MRHVKARSPAKCDRVTYSQSCTFAQRLANLVDPVLTNFDWISAYYTVLAIASWKQCLCGRVASHGVSLLPVRPLFPVTLISEWVSSHGTPAPYEVVSHRSVPFLSLYTKSAHYDSCEVILSLPHKIIVRSSHKYACT